MKFRAVITFGGLLLLALSSVVEAAPSRTTVLVRGSLPPPPEPTGPAQRALTSSLEFDLPEDGVFRVEFSESMRKDWSSSFAGGSGEVQDFKQLTLLRGEGEFVSLEQRVPVAGSLYNVNGHPYLFVHFSAPGDSDKRRLFEVRIPVRESSERIASTLTVATEGDFRGTSCSSLSHIHQEGMRLATSSLTPELRESNQRVIELATDADKQYFDLYGVNTNAQIATIVNAADVIYQRDLNLRFNIIRQNTQTSTSQPYQSTDAVTLLEEFRSHTINTGHLGSADLYHLFTGKDLNGSTIGVAYLGVACLNSWAFGLTQRVSSALDYIVFAHEVGHNLDADHDSITEPKTIMFPSASSSQTTFSATSISQVNNFVSSSGSCLAVSTATPTPSPTATASPTPTATQTPTPTPSATPSPTSSPTLSPTASPTAAPTDSPTAAPTSSPTSAPTPEATPEPRSTPNPDDRAPSPETTTVLLRTSYSRASGWFDGRVTIRGERGSYCRLSLDFSDTVDFVKRRSYSVLSRDMRQLNFRARFSGSVRSASERIYVRAVYGPCQSGGERVFSETTQFSPFIKSRREKVSARSWLGTNIRSSRLAMKRK